MDSSHISNIGSSLGDLKQQVKDLFSTWEGRFLVTITIIIILLFLAMIFEFANALGADIKWKFWEWDWKGDFEKFSKIFLEYILPTILGIFFVLTVGPTCYFVYNYIKDARNENIYQILIIFLLALTSWGFLYLMFYFIGIEWIFEPWNWPWDGIINKLTIPMFSILVLILFSLLGYSILTICKQEGIMTNENIIKLGMKILPYFLSIISVLFIWFLSKKLGFKGLTETIEFWNWPWATMWPVYLFNLLFLIIMLFIGFYFTDTIIKNMKGVSKGGIQTFFLKYFILLTQMVSGFYTSFRNSLIGILIFIFIYSGVYLLMYNFGGPYGILEIWNWKIWDNLKFWESAYWNNFVIRQTMSSSVLFILLLSFIGLSFNTGLAEKKWFTSLVVILAILIGYIGIINTYNTNIDGMRNPGRRRPNKKKIEMLERKLRNAPINNKFNLNNEEGKIRGAPLKFNNEKMAKKRVNQMKNQIKDFKKQFNIVN